MRRGSSQRATRSGVMSWGWSELKRRRGVSVRASTPAMRSRGASGSGRSRPHAPNCVPVSTTSRAPRAWAAATSRATSSMERETSRPRVRGTMQKAQTSLQPSCAFTKARVCSAGGVAGAAAGGGGAAALRRATRRACSSPVVPATKSAPSASTASSPAERG